MKRVLAVLLLTVGLSLPSLAGHTTQGNGYCKCGTPGCMEDYPGECVGIPSVGTVPNESPADATAEMGILLVALLFWLRLKA